MAANEDGTSVSGVDVGSGASWGWLLTLGILMTGLGIIGLGMTYWLTVVAVFWFGILTLVGGVGQLFDAFHHKEWKGVIWHVIIGILYILAGVVLVATPINAAFWLTLLLALILIVVGVSRMIMAFQLRRRSGAWIWVLLSGMVSIFLGVLVYGTVTPPSAEALATPEGQLEWLRSWGWVIGLFVAIELIMDGVALISIALGIKSGES